MLELGAVNLDAGPRIAEQSLRHGLYHSGLTRSCWSQEQQVSHRASRRIQSRQKHLVDLHNFLNRLLLTYDSAAQGGFKLSRIVAAAVGIEYCGEVRSHRVIPDFPEVCPFLSCFSLLGPALLPLYCRPLRTLAPISGSLGSA